MNISWAVRYRPRKLAEMVGQKGAVSQINGFVKSKNFPQALLITGPVGAGKTSLCRIIAALAKVIILDEVHALPTISSHAFLKSLEEPPSHVLYLLCTNQPQSLLESIRSRCVPIKLTLLTTLEISSLLQRIIDKEKLDFGVKKKLLVTKISQASSGQARIAIQLLQAVANIWRGGETTKTDQLLEMALVQTDVYGVDTVATKFLLSLYRKKWAVALATLGDTNNQGTLLSLLLDLNSHLLAKLANQSNLTSSWSQRECLKVLTEFKAIPTLEQALQVHHHLVSSKLAAGQYLVPERHLLIAMLAKVMDKC